MDSVSNILHTIYEYRSVMRHPILKKYSTECMAYLPQLVRFYACMAQSHIDKIKQEYAKDSRYTHLPSVDLATADDFVWSRNRMLGQMQRLREVGF